MITLEKLMNSRSPAFFILAFCWTQAVFKALRHRFWLLRMYYSKPKSSQPIQPKTARGTVKV